MFAKQTPFNALKFLSFSAVLSMGLLPTAHAADLSWSGTYRIEGVKISNPELNSEHRDKAYMLQHLTLSPKIVAADGVTIYSRFEIFNNKDYANSQLGQFFGNGPSDSTTTAGTATGSDTLSGTENSEIFNVSQLYVQWAQEYGSLVVGRVPLQFGLGLTYSAGNGAFDHWFDTRDLVGYKMVFGNIFAMPMLGKMNEGTLGYENDVNDYLLQVQYENPETELSLGAMAEIRSATSAGTDTPLGVDGMGGASSVRSDKGYQHRLFNLFAKERAGNFNLGIEAGLLSGTAGVKTSTGTEVKLNSYGIALEIDYKKPESRWNFGLKAGTASGDNPGTNDTYESFVFDRNYDVAMMMFNHPLGRADVLRTNAYTNRGTKVASDLPDTESIANAFYLSPRFNYKAGEKSSWGATFTYGVASQKATSGSTSSTDLGYELDVNFTYKPYERLLWVTEAGFLFPGAAWKQEVSGAEGDSKFAYGLTTKAAISF